MKNKKIIKKFLILLVLVMILFTVYKIIQIYAVFYSEANGQTSEKISNWTIKVNGTDIAKSQSFTIDSFNVGTDAHVKPGKLAPGLSGNFGITINPTGTEVSIRYDINIDSTNLTNNNIVIDSVEEKNQSNILTKTSENVYTGIIPLNNIKNGQIDNIVTTLKWLNNGTDDQEQNLDSVLNTRVKVPITVTITQYLGESL